jgi:hypothetical protein
MVGLVSERLPRTGSLGIVLTAGIGLGMAGGVGVPLIGRLADGFLAKAIDPAQARAVLERVEQRLPAHLATAIAGTSAVRASDVDDALTAVQAALADLRQSGEIRGDATATALRAVVATHLDDPVVAEANAILQPAEARGGQESFRYVAPAALFLVAVFGTMYLNDRRRGGYRAERLRRNA